MYIIYILISVPILLFLWEHIAIVNNQKIKPTFFIDVITYLLQAFWYKLGMFYAYLGTWIEYLHLHKLYLTVKSFVDAFIRLFMSIEYFEKGLDKVISLYNSGRELIFYSTITLVIVIMLGTAIHNYFIKFF